MAVTPLEGRALLAISPISLKVVPQVLVPNGRYVPVKISGTISSSRSETPKAYFKVTDQYRRDEPFAPLSLHKISAHSYTYSATFYLQARRAHTSNFPEGRHYYVLVAAGDQDGGTGTTAPVLVPSDEAAVKKAIHHQTHPTPVTPPRPTRLPAAPKQTGPFPNLKL